MPHSSPRSSPSGPRLNWKNWKNSGLRCKMRASHLRTCLLLLCSQSFYTALCLSWDTARDTLASPIVPAISSACNGQKSASHFLPSFLQVFTQRSEVFIQIEAYPLLMLPSISTFTTQSLTSVTFPPAAMRLGTHLCIYSSIKKSHGFYTLVLHKNVHKVVPACKHSAWNMEAGGSRSSLVT